MWNTIVNDAKSLTRYIKSNDLAYRTQGFSLFEYACLTGKLTVVKRLLKKADLDLNSVNNLGLTILHRFNYTIVNYSILALLLNDPRINPNQKDLDGRTPLHHAVLRKKTELLAVFLHYSCFEVNKLDQFNFSPLALAVQNSYFEGVELLLDHPECDGSSVLARAVQIPGAIGTKIFKCILIDPHTNPNIPDSLGTALFHARRLHLPIRINMLLYDDLETKAIYFPAVRKIFLTCFLCGEFLPRLPTVLWYTIFNYNRVLH
jgi:ankyrin repeat protein